MSLTQLIIHSTPHSKERIKGVKLLVNKKLNVHFREYDLEIGFIENELISTTDETIIKNKIRELEELS